MTDDLERELQALDERIERVGGRLAFGYGTDSDRAGWRRWLDELTARRDELTARRDELRGRIDDEERARPARDDRNTGATSPSED